MQKIPWDVKLLFSLPAFGKMSCLLILRYIVILNNIKSDSKIILSKKH